MFGMSEPLSPTPHAPADPLATAPGRVEGLSAGQILPLVYDELRRLAAARLSNEGRESVNPTSLVHAVYLRIVGDAAGASPPWNSRGHFFGAAAIAMRRILVERARARAQLKRGGGWSRVEIRDFADDDSDAVIDVLSLDAALDELETLDNEKFRVVMLRYFSGLTIEQTAAALGVSGTTVKRHWIFARLWLLDRVRQLGDA